MLPHLTGSPPADPAQSLFKKFAAQSQQTPRLSVETGGKYMFHYLIQNGVIFLTLTDKAYPKKLAFQYLEELSGEFGQLYGGQVDSVTRPYAFIKFGGCLHKPWTLTHACGALPLPEHVRAVRAFAQRRPLLTHPVPLRLLSLLSPHRHLYPEDQEALPRHPDAAQPRQAD